jgi:hypothetical protein
MITDTDTITIAVIIISIITIAIITITIITISPGGQMRIHMPTTRGKQAADSAGKSESEICSPQDPIVYHSY